MLHLLDRIMNLDIGNRGVDKLYEPARARNSEPLCAAAARTLLGIAAGECVVLITGSLTRPWVSPRIGETDGPVGIAALARALSYGFNAIPVVVTDTSLIEPIGETLRAAGLTPATLEQAKRATANRRFCSIAVMQGFPIDDAEARSEGKRVVEALSPKAVISVERAGMTPRGTYHNMLGQDFSEGRARIDYLVEAAAARGVPTVGVGDGGNEIGMGAVAEAVHQHVPHGPTLCARLATDVLLPAGVSNWGCYAIVGALVALTGKAELVHTPAMERRLVEAAANAGLVDGNTGKCEPTVDGLSLDVHTALVEVMMTTALRAMKTSH